MLLRLYYSPSGIKGKLGHLLLLLGDGPIVYEGLESLSIFALEHHVELLPAIVAIISLLGVNVKGFQEVESPGIEHFPVLRLMGGIEMEGGRFPAVMQVRGHGITVEDVGKVGETSLSGRRQGGIELSTGDLFKYIGNIVMLCVNVGDVRGKS